MLLRHYEQLQPEHSGLNRCTSWPTSSPPCLSRYQPSTKMLLRPRGRRPNIYKMNIAKNNGQGSEAVMYLRVSTPEQADPLNLKNQEDGCRRLATQRNIAVA